jgi:threonine/homoserine/homoserine lactone efflux protein
MPEAFLKGITLGFLLSISVGPVIFSIIKQSLNNGHRGGFAFVAGVSASDIALVLISNVFTELFSSISTHRLQIGIAGSVFLIVMGVYFLFWITTSTTFVSHTAKERITIFATCLLFVLATDIAKVMLAGKIRNRLTPHNIHNINRLNGIILIGFGIALIWGLLTYGK